MGVVTVNWRGAPLVLEALESLRASVGRPWRFVIVDNASGDGSLERLSGLGDDVTLIASERNLGWAGGCNLGIRAAFELGCEHVLLLNSDAKVRPDTLTMLMRAAARHGEAVYGCLVRWAGGRGEIQFCGDARVADTGLTRWVALEDMLDPELPEMIPTESVFGAAMFFSRSVYQRVGAFEETFFLNYEETDWSCRAARLGVPRWVVRDAVVDHHGSASIGGSQSPMQIYFMLRNALLFARRNGTRLQLLRLFRDTLHLYYRWSGLKLRLTGSGEERVPATRVMALRLALWHFVIGRFGDAPIRVREAR